MRNRLRAEEKKAEDVPVPPIGSFVLLDYLDGRISEYGEELEITEDSAYTEIHVRLILLRRLLQDRLKHLESTDPARVEAEAKSLLGRLAERDKALLPESLPVLESRKIRTLLDRIRRLVEDQGGSSPVPE